MSRLLIAASGTGGHLFPALAVSQALPPDPPIHLLGVTDRLERHIFSPTILPPTITPVRLSGHGVQPRLYPATAR